ncbi:S-layer homology domain-containing protein [Clostridia bacterium]|nr:S-layer homology domain-containing protein [Clostridia bacterium]
MKIIIRKILSLMLTVFLLFGFVPTTLAVTDSNVCEIGEIGYLSLNEALAAASDSETTTIKILQDISLSTGIIITKDIIIDLNDNNIAISVATGKALQADGGSLNLMGNGELNISSSAADSCVYANNGGTIEVTSVTHAKNSSGYSIYAENSGSVITVAGDVFGDAPAYAYDSGVIVIQGNVSGLYGISASRNGSITVDGDVTSTTTNTSTYAVNASYGANVTVNGTVKGSAGALSTGYTTTRSSVMIGGDVIALYGIGVNVNVSDMTVLGDVFSYNSYGTYVDSYWQYDTASLSVGGNVFGYQMGVYAASSTGSFSTVQVGGNVAASSDSGSGVYATNNSKVTIDGGIATVPAPDATYIYLYTNGSKVKKTPDDYESTSSKEGYTEYKANSAYVWAKTLTLPNICEITETQTAYPLLASAIYEGDAQTIKLFGDLDYYYPVSIVNKDITIDLDGQSLTFRPTRSDLTVEQGSLNYINGEELNVVCYPSEMSLGVHSEDSEIRVNNVEGPVEVATSQDTNSSSLTIMGDLEVSSDMVSARANANGDIKIYGDYTAIQGPMVFEGTITVDGAMSIQTEDRFVYIGSSNNWITVSQFTVPTTKDGYTTYTGTGGTLWVKDSNIAPSLVAGEVTRTSDEDATVKFTSDKAGDYFFDVVDSGDDEPAIDTTVAGSSCDTLEQTIALDSLTPGAKDIYIVVKDSANNISDMLKIMIPEYIALQPGTIQFISSSWEVEEGYSGSGKVERIGGTNGIVTVDYYTTNGTAIAGTNYMATSGTLTWADGENGEKSFPCTIYGDNIYNGYLDFTYTLYNPTGGATLGTQKLLPITISDDENPPIPTGLKATAGNGKVTLTWDSVNSAFYKLYYSTSSGVFSDENSIVVYDKTTTTIDKLQNRTTYYFAIKAGHSSYSSPLSDEVTAIPFSSRTSSATENEGKSIRVITYDGGTSVNGILTITNNGVQVDIAGDDFGKMGETNQTVIINAGKAIVSFDKDATDYICSKAESSKIRLIISEVAPSTLSDKAQVLIGDRPVYDFTLMAGEAQISALHGFANIRIPYTLKLNENAEALIVYYINDHGSLSHTRGVYNRETGTVDLTVRHFSRYAISYNEVSFDDVTDGAWYFDPVTFCAARGITVGTGNHLFNANNTLTRGQFIVMLMHAYDIEVNEDLTDNFDDAGDTYYTSFLATAKQLGISKGIGDNLYAPNAEITRQDMFTLLYNALQVLDELPAEKSGGVLENFSDAGTIADYAKDPIQTFVAAGIVSGNEGKLTPTNSATRAQMAQVLYNLLSDFSN